MSFILDALRRAEKERNARKPPDLRVVSVEPVARRPRVWPWVLASVLLLLNALVLAALLWPDGSTEMVRTTSAPLSDPGQGVHVHQVSPPAGQRLARRKSDGGDVPPMPSPRDPRTSQSEAGAGARPVSPPVPSPVPRTPIPEADEKPTRLASPPATSWTTATASELAESSSRPPASSVQSAREPGAELTPYPAQSPPTAAAAEKTAQAGQAQETTDGKAVARAVLVEESEGKVASGSDKPAIPGLAEGQPPPEALGIRAGAPADTTGPPMQSAKPEPPLAREPPPASAEPTASRRPEPVPLLRDLPIATRERLPEMEISAHVYADDPGQRFVFINMRSYRVGDRIGEEGFLLEEITRDGVIINYGDGWVRLPVSR